MLICFHLHVFLETWFTRWTPRFCLYMEKKHLKFFSPTYLQFFGFQKLLIPGWVRKLSVLILKNVLIWYAQYIAFDSQSPAPGFYVVELTGERMKAKIWCFSVTNASDRLSSRVFSSSRATTTFIIFWDFLMF